MCLIILELLCQVTRNINCLPLSFLGVSSSGALSRPRKQISIQPNVESLPVPQGSQWKLHSSVYLVSIMEWLHFSVCDVNVWSWSRALSRGYLRNTWAFLENDVFSLLEIEHNHSRGRAVERHYHSSKKILQSSCLKTSEHSIFCWCSEDTLVCKVG